MPLPRLLPRRARPFVGALSVLSLAAACASSSASRPSAVRSARGEPEAVLAGSSRRAPAPARPAMDAAGYAKLERGVLAEVNRVRTNPSGYAALLEARLQYYHGSLYRAPGDEVSLQTREGAAAVREAIAALREARPMPALKFSGGLAHAARDHVRDQGPRGTMAHEGSDGSMPWDRADRYGSWKTRVSENLAFGPSDPRDVVEELLIDDGVRDRGHRKAMLDPDLRVAGVSCGPHKAYRVMCDVLHAVGYAEKR